MDDARLVVLTRPRRARTARVLAAHLLHRREARGRRLAARLSNGKELHARAIVNAAGPWVKSVLLERLISRARPGAPGEGQPHRGAARYRGEHAYILQNPDRRVVFMIPYEGEFTLIGTTDVPVRR